MTAVPSPTWVGLNLCTGRYHVTAKLGEGGMGFVYRGKDTHLQCPVVIKVPRPAMLEDPDFAGRFAQEVRSLVKLTHPHIVKVLDVGQHEGAPFAVLQHLPGGSLRDRLRTGPRGTPTGLPVGTLHGWLAPIASALDFVHQQNIVHRDVKPDNILFDSQGNAYLTDFGVAKVWSAHPPTGRESAVTGQGIVLGTPEYLAPELVLGRSFDGRADQYALAVVVHEVLAGRLPFGGPNPAAILVKHTAQKVPRLLDVAPCIPQALSEAVARAMAKRPGERFASCGEFARVVLAAVPGMPGFAAPFPAQPPAGQPPPGKPGLVPQRPGRRPPLPGGAGKNGLPAPVHGRIMNRFRDRLPGVLLGGYLGQPVGPAPRPGR